MFVGGKTLCRVDQTRDSQLFNRGVYTIAQLVISSTSIVAAAATAATIPAATATTDTTSSCF